MNHTHPKQFIYAEHYGNNHLYADERSLQRSFPLHWHDYYEIELCTGGEGIQRINGVDYPFSKGSFILLRPSDFHEVEVRQPLTYFNASFSSLAIDKKYLHKLLKKEGCIHGTLPIDDFDFLCMVFQQTVKQTQTLPVEDNPALQALLHVILSFLFKTPQFLAIEEKPAFSLGEIIEYLHTHFSNSPSLQEIAAHSGLQPNYFCRKFKQATGKTYIEYLNHLKIEHAKKMLQTCDLSVTEIAFDCGFPSYSSFSREFKKQIGYSPLQYKQQKQSF
jgi:AraC-like DNA-binding protein